MRCVKSVACDEQVATEALAFDVGFYNGDDTALLLMQGYRVVAIEANAALVARGRHRFAAAIRSGQLVLLHQALARNSTDVGKDQPFYINRHNRQWSSFKPMIGCRPAQWTEADIKDELESSLQQRIGRDCEVTNVRTASCAALFERYGMPLLLKLDIEGSEGPCIRALRKGTIRPAYLAIEAGSYDPMLYLLLVALGYNNFKWVDQEALSKRTHGAKGWGISSGPIGEAALDCHFGYSWRSSLSMVRLHSIVSPRRAQVGKSAPPRPALEHNVSAAQLSSCGSWADIHARHRLVHQRFEPWGGDEPLAADRNSSQVIRSRPAVMIG